MGVVESGKTVLHGNFGKVRGAISSFNVHTQKLANHFKACSVSPRHKLQYVYQATIFHFRLSHGPQTVFCHIQDDARIGRRRWPRDHSIFKGLQNPIRSIHPITWESYGVASLVKNVDPSVTYLAYHPLFRPYIKGISHSQVSDKAFEERAIQAVERHLTAHYTISRRLAANPKREEGWRHLTGEQDVAEWDGIWTSDDGHFFFLETKHSMSMESDDFSNLFRIQLMNHRTNFRKLKRNSCSPPIFSTSRPHLPWFLWLPTTGQVTGQ